LKKYLKKHYQDFNQLIFLLEATGSYSDYLIEMCAEYRIKAVIINPKTSHHFAKSLGIRNKTDKIDARMIYQYQRLIDTQMITVPRINKEAKILSAYLVSYQLTMKQRIALDNHLEHVRDKDLFQLLQKDLKRAYKLEEQILKADHGLYPETSPVKSGLSETLNYPRYRRKVGSRPALLIYYLSRY